MEPRTATAMASTVETRAARRPMAWAARLGLLLSIVKVVVYLVELQLMRALAWVRRLPLDPAPRFTRQEKQRLREVLRALWGDWLRILRDHPNAQPRPRLGLHLRRYGSILRDLPRYLRRKRAARAHDLSHLTIEGDYPSYYLTNYHYQTDGYFSEASALRYDHQIELLFVGMGHMVRKVSYGLLAPHLPAQPEVLEVGAGTGASGDQFKRLYPEARLTLLDLSRPYLSYAAGAYPGRFEACRAQAVETLEEDSAWDCVYACFLMHEIPRSSWDEVLSRLLRVLRPGGILLLVDSKQDCDGEADHFTLDAFERDFYEPYFPDFRRADLEVELRRAGFEQVRTVPVMFSKAVIASRPPVVS